MKVVEGSFAGFVGAIFDKEGWSTVDNLLAGRICGYNIGVIYRFDRVLFTREMNLSDSQILLWLTCQCVMAFLLPKGVYKKGPGFEL